jgi:hypothetical protein
MNHVHYIYIFAGVFSISLTSVCSFIPVELKVYMKQLKEIFLILKAYDC